MKTLSFNHEGRKSQWRVPGSNNAKTSPYNKPIRPIEIAAIYEGTCSFCNQKHIHVGDRIIKICIGWAAKVCLEAASKEQVAEITDSP